MDSARALNIAFKYVRDGYVHIQDIISPEVVSCVREECIRIRKIARQLSTWNGVSCASKHSETLSQWYTSSIMQNVAEILIGDVTHLFNDQVVVKMPNDGMVFEPHFDNFFGPNRDGKIHTVNICCILDDFTDANGTLEIQNKAGEWIKVMPKAGDLVAINGNTYHRSGPNTTDVPRALYACVYTEDPISFDGFYKSPFIETNLSHIRG